jgi:hypothetical protein
LYSSTSYLLEGSSVENIAIGASECQLRGLCPPFALQMAGKALGRSRV